MIKLKAYAKINLALEVMDTENGYHKVNNLMVPIDLYDTLTFKKADNITIEDDPFPGNNIIEKAARLFFEETKIQGGVYITLKKKIPHAAGLAGGSTDAATTLKGLNMLYDAKLTNQRLVELSAKLGSDVGFFIETKTSLCKGRGEIVEPLSITTPKINVYLIKPNTGLSTALVYKNYEYKGNSKENNIKNIIKALDTKDYGLLFDNIFNDLKDVSLSLNEEMKDIYTKLTEAGLTPYVSGSGPTMYLLDPSLIDLIKAKKIVEETCTVVLTHTFSY